MEYPFLAKNHINGKPYVVLFTEPETGVVVVNETDSENIKFGTIGNFDENSFELLSPDEVVRLNN
ncbi:MAG: hypothetical protein VZR36_06530 [Prevotella sp.]|jgi:hypothetical protein|nr:hypothetical protein [Prevotella sp.]